MTEHLRLNGVYWGLTALCLLAHPEVLDSKEMIKYIQSCQTEEGTSLLNVSAFDIRWLWRTYRT